MPKIDKEKRRQDHDRLQKGYKFSKEQAYVLVPHERIGQSKSQVIPKEGKLAGKEVNICDVKGTCQVSDSTCSEEIIKEMA